MRLTRLAIVTGVVAVIVAGGCSSSGGGSAGWKTVHVQFTPTSGDAAPVGDQFCETDPGTQCESLNKTTDVAQSGDLVGVTVEGEVYGAVRGSTSYTVAVGGTFTGTVTPCGDGTGSFLYVGSGTAGQTFAYTYTIVDGTGTGVLTGITGSFSTKGAGGDPLVISGSIRCRQQH